MLCLGLERLGIPYVPSSANFVLGRFGARAIEVRDALGGQAILVRDRSYEAPGCVRITVGTREQTAPPAGGPGRDLEAMSKPILVFDMDGVLVDVSESYRETIACAAEQFTGVKPTPRVYPGMQEPRRLQRRLEAHPLHRHRSGSGCSVRTRERLLPATLPGTA